MVKEVCVPLKVCVLFLRMCIHFFKLFDAKHTISLKRPCYHLDAT